MFERIYHIVIKELIQAVRDRKKRFFLIAPPVIQLFLFGYVVTTDVDYIATALYDRDHTQQSRELINRFTASGYFYIEYLPESGAEIKELLDRGVITCAIQINEGFGAAIKANTPTNVQVLIDGTNSNTALVAMNYATEIVTEYSTGLLADGMQQAPVDVRPRVWYNPELDSRNYNVPGVIALILMVSCLMLTSMAIVREREVGTMEQLMVSPIRPLELILGKTLPFALVGFGQLIFVTFLGVFWFDVPMKGSIGTLALGTAVYLVTILGLGLFISTVSQTQQQALMATMFFLMPSILLSGFVFPIESMPRFFQYITYLNPLRYFLVIIRGIFLKGSGLTILWPQILALLGLSSIITIGSASRFQKRVK